MMSDFNREKAMKETLQEGEIQKKTPNIQILTIIILL